MTEILVVEDDLAVSQMLTVLLQRAGYDVTPVPNAAEAWQKVQRGVDLVVLDLRKAAGFTDYFVIASGTSCRQQIEHVTTRRPMHLAEFLAQAFA